MKNTRNLADFGHRERQSASELMGALNTSNDKTGMLSNHGVAVEFNPMSAMVFLVDEDFNVAIMEGDELVDFISCPNCGNEGTKSDLEDTENDCCKEHLENY